MRALFLDERSFASRPHLERPLPPQRQALLVAGVETRLQETRRSPLHQRRRTSRRRRRLRLLAVRCSGLKSLNVGAPHIDVGFFRSTPTPDPAISSLTKSRDSSIVVTYLRLTPEFDRPFTPRGRPRGSTS